GKAGAVGRGAENGGRRLGEPAGKTLHARAERVLGDAKGATRFVTSEAAVDAAEVDGRAEAETALAVAVGDVETDGAVLDTGDAVAGPGSQDRAGRAGVEEIGGGEEERGRRSGHGAPLVFTRGADDGRLIGRREWQVRLAEWAGLVRRFRGCRRGFGLRFG